MYQFLQITINENTYNSTNFWWDLLKDFILPVFLAAFGAYMVYYIFVKETQRDKEKELNRKNEERSDKLLYFSSLVGGVLSTSKDQLGNIKLYIEKIKKNDVEFHPFHQVTLYDLKRVVEVLNLENYLLAYTNAFHDNKKESVREFKEIIASIDFIYDVLKSILKQLDKAQAFDYERKIEYQQAFKTADIIVGRLLIILEANDKDLNQSFSSVYKNYNDNNNADRDLVFYYDYYFAPLNKFCADAMNKKKPADLGYEEIFELATLTREGKRLFSHIKSENQSLMKELIEEFKNLNKEIPMLEIHAKKILSLI